MSAEQTEVITATEARQAENERRSLLAKFANRYGLEPNKMMATLRATAFKGDVTNEQMAALLIVADQHGLNPWCKEIYAFPSQAGIVPVVGVDGWARIINEHPQFDGMDFEQDDEACTCKMYRKDRKHPTVVTEYMSECNRGTQPWRSHPKRMLRHKAMIQCARIAFSFAGIYDPDEAEVIVENEAEIDVTPRPDGKLSPQRLRKVAEGLLEAVKSNDGRALWGIWNELNSDEQQFLWSTLRSYERTAIKKLQESAKHWRTGDLTDWATTALNGAQDAEALASSWRAVQDAYAENDSEPPAELAELFDQRLTALGGPRE